MKASTLFACGAGSLLGSFAVPALSLPLQAIAFGLFVASELVCRHEIKYLRPLQARRYQVWLDTLNHAFEHKTGAAQAYATNQLDWHYRQQNRQLNLSKSLREKYFVLFTQGRSQETVNVKAEMVQPESRQNTPIQQQPQPSQPATRPIEPDHPIRSATSNPSPTSPTTQDLPLLRLDLLLNTSFLLIYGCPGSGKSTLARRIAEYREAAGHAITVADPHGSKQEWGEWTVIGSGRDYERLNQYLTEYEAAITADYRTYSQGFRDFPYQTLIVDEFTQWADRCAYASLFVKASCSDIRKLHRCVVLVSHADTIAGLGGATGMRAAINRAAVKLELEAEIDLNGSGEYVATGYGWLQYPGKERVRVQIPLEKLAETVNP